MRFPLLSARKRPIYLLAIFMGLMWNSVPALGQLNYTTVTATTNTWSSIYGAGGGTSMLPDLQSADPDDDITIDEPIGFTFNFQGVGYDRFILGTNGFIKLGTTPPANYGGTASTSTSGSILQLPAWQNNNTLAPFNVDVVPGTLGENDYLYKVSGAPGSRVLTIEWHDISLFSGAQMNSFSFQAKLYEGTNVIEYVYGPWVSASATAAARVANIGIRGQSLLTGQLLYLNKASSTAWSAAAIGAVPAGGYGGGAFASTSGFIYTRNVLPPMGLTYRFVPTTAATNNVSVTNYALGRIANPQNTPYAVLARVTNETATATGAFQVQLSVSGTLQQNGSSVPYSFTDNQTVTLPGATGNPSTQIAFTPFTPPQGTTGDLTVTVTAQKTGDQTTTNNTSTTTLTLSPTEISNNTSAAETGGIGFTGAYGEFLTRFHTASACQLTGANVVFQTTGINYQLVVFDDDGPGGTPGTQLYASTTKQTVSSALQTIAITPALTVSGDFFVGVRQTALSKVQLGYEMESPVRADAFYFRGYSSLPVSGSWTEFNSISYPFRPAVGITLAVPTNLPPNCAFASYPANNATNIPTNASISFNSGGGNPTGYDIYLSTNQALVQAEDASVRVATNITTPGYAPASPLSRLTAYYYKVVARNANGPAMNCSVVKFTTAPTPMNDNCANATTLTIKPFGSCGTGTAGTTLYASEDPITDPPCSAGINQDVWYKFSTGNYSTVNVTLTPGTASGQLGFQLLNGCGGNSIGCLQNATTTVALDPQLGIQPNTTYWLRVFTTTSLSNALPGTFSICVSAPAVPLPAITGFTPTAAPAGSGVVITGSNFTGATSVKFNGVNAAGFTVNSATQITATVPATATTGKITVSTSSGLGTSSASFKVTPTLTSFAPASGAPGATVTISGSGFTGVSSVSFNGVGTVFTVLNASTITATVPALATTGRISVMSPGGTATSVGTFTVAPIITGFTPGQGAPGSVVVVSGLNFISGSVVRFNGTTATTTYNSTRQLTATVPAGATTGALTVTNANGIATSATSFTVVAGAVPTITSFSPGSGLLGSTVTITGTNFSGATTVRFNTANAPATVLNATQVQAILPTGATTGRLYVVTPAGMAQSAGNFTVILPPTISSFAPTSGQRGAVVMIYGANFTNATSVTIGGAAATFTVDYSSRITATVPQAAVTGSITVTTVAGTATSANAFTVTGPRPALVTTSTPTLPLELVIYPNPARDWLEVQITGATEPTAVEVINTLGQVVRRSVVLGANDRLSVVDLPSGRYMVRAAGHIKPLLIGK